MFFIGRPRYSNYRVDMIRHDHELIHSDVRIMFRQTHPVSLDDFAKSI
jgi:hypothetical protein